METKDAALKQHQDLLQVPIWGSPHTLKLQNYRAIKRLSQKCGKKSGSELEDKINLNAAIILAKDALKEKGKIAKFLDVMLWINNGTISPHDTLQVAITSAFLDSQPNISLLNALVALVKNQIVIAEGRMRFKIEQRQTKRVTK